MSFEFDILLKVSNNLKLILSFFIPTMLFGVIVFNYLGIGDVVFNIKNILEINEDVIIVLAISILLVIGETFLFKLKTSINKRRLAVFIYPVIQILVFVPIFITSLAVSAGS